MKNFVTIYPFKTFAKVRYYAFWVEDRNQSEAATFFARFEDNTPLAQDLNLLVARIRRKQRG
ncbi:MAG: hypothetical protein EAZ91_20945 [Cytophagales bacterium]|nr:MAG: hypothetical protein EAZ91_20945 [Cytophagales bacterium]